MSALVLLLLGSGFSGWSASVPTLRFRSHYKIAGVTARPNNDPLQPFHPAVREWFSGAFEAPTRPQTLGWPAIARGESTLILAPTGSGKTLAAFLFVPRSPDVRAPNRRKRRRCRVLYVSPLKALAVDVERNLRAPLAGIAQIADAAGRHRSSRRRLRFGPATRRKRARALPARAGRHPDHDARIAVSAADVERARGAPLDRHRHHRRDPRAGPDQARRASGAVDRTARPRTRRAQPPQRIGLSATQRPLDEVARFLGGVERVSVAAPEGARVPRPKSPTSSPAIRATSATGRSPSSTPARKRR